MTHPTCLWHLAIDLSNTNWSDVSAGSFNIVVQVAVPLPVAVWLFGTALIGFVGLSRKRKVG